MGRWMDRRTGGWVNGRMDGEMGRWMGGRVCGWDRWVDEFVNGWVA